MPNEQFNYALVRLASGDARGEQLNAGIAVFSNDGLDVHMLRRLDKLRAISAAVDVERVRDAILDLPRLDNFLRQQGRGKAQDRLEALAALTPVKFSSLGSFKANSLIAYADVISHLMKSLVEPEPAKAKVRNKRTKLLSIVKTALKAERVLARKGEDISEHRIVSNVQIAEGLTADFVLKNGAMHVIETVDASDSDTSIKKIVSDIAVSALVLEQARMTFGEDETKSRLIYDASSEVERSAMPSLMAAAHQGAELINWASQDDRNKLLVKLSSLATPYEKKVGRSSINNVNASSQHKFRLN